MSVLRGIPGIPIQRLARFLAVIAIAIAAGHLMQTLAARKPDAKAAAAVSIPQDIVQLMAVSRPEPFVTVAATTEQAVTAPEIAKPAEIILVASADPVVEEAPVELTLADTCPIDLALSASAGAVINISLSAPCHALERVVLRHAGLAVTARLDAMGSLSQALPALTSAATVEVMFADGNAVGGLLEIAEAATLRRFGVQWQGPDAFVVHGLENGADYGQPGDISPVNPAQPESGTLTMLGDATVYMPLLAQIYTYPTSESRSAEVVVEASVTAATCRQDLLGEIIESHKDQVEITELTLTMPECSGIGDFLVLKNLATDLKLAAN